MVSLATRVQKTLKEEAAALTLAGTKAPGQRGGVGEGLWGVEGGMIGDKKCPHCMHF